MHEEASEKPQRRSIRSPVQEPHPPSGAGSVKVPSRGRTGRSPSPGKAREAAPALAPPPRPGRSPSPTSSAVVPASQRGMNLSGLGMNLSGLDHNSIVALSQSCTEELDVKLREKNALAKLLSDLKKKKMQYDTKMSKKRREVDSTVVQTMDMEKKLQAVRDNSNKMVQAEVTGLRSENERMGQEVDHLRGNLREATESYDRELEEVERLKQMLFTYRKEIGVEAKQRDNVQQDLRASRTAQSLMINRLDDMEQRNRALKKCVAETFNL